MEAKFLGHHFGGLAAGQPVLYGCTFKRLIEFTTGFDRGFFDELHVTRFTQFSVRQFEATSTHSLVAKWLQIPCIDGSSAVIYEGEDYQPHS